MAEGSAREDLNKLSELPDDITEMILKRVPIESIAKLRVVSKEWNSLLSHDKYLTLWREKSQEDPWLLLTVNSNNRSDCYRLNMSSMTAKAFPFPVNGEFLASVGGLGLWSLRSWNDLILYDPLTTRGICIPWREDFNEVQRVLVCNPARETFVQLPMPILRQEHGIMMGDLLWKGEQYQIVADYDNFIEVFDFPSESWVILQSEWTTSTFRDLVFFRGLYWCTFGISMDKLMVFRIEEDYTSREFYVRLPELSGRMEPNLVVCGSSLVLITRDSRQLCLCLWELEFESNLNITSNLNLSWKLISQMPPDVMGFLNSGKHLLFDSLSKHRFLTMRNYICILTEGNGRLAFFNKEDGSWSYWGVDDSRKNITTTVDAHLCDPSLINLESMTNVLGARRGART